MLSIAKINSVFVLAFTTIVLTQTLTVMLSKKNTFQTYPGVRDVIAILC